MRGTFTVIPIDAPSSEKRELPDARVPYVEVEQGHALPSCFSFHTASKRPSHGMFSATFFAFPCILLVITVFKMAPMFHAECELVFLSTRRRCGVLRRKYMC